MRDTDSSQMDKNNNEAQQTWKATHLEAEIGLLGLQGTATLSKGVF